MFNFMSVVLHHGEGLTMSSRISMDAARYGIWALWRGETSRGIRFETRWCADADADADGQGVRGETATATATATAPFFVMGVEYDIEQIAELTFVRWVYWL